MSVLLDLEMNGLKKIKPVAAAQSLVYLSKIFLVEKYMGYMSTGMFTVSLK